MTQDYNANALLPVEQCDRELAAAYVEEHIVGAYQRGTSAAIFKGIKDDHPVVQLLARHRIEEGKRLAVPSDEVVERILAVFNAGLVRVPDETNPRGFVDMYKPQEAMRAALSALKGE